jgi:hypothetical protein
MIPFNEFYTQDNNETTFYAYFRNRPNPPIINWGKVDISLRHYIHRLETNAAIEWDEDDFYKDTFPNNVIYMLSELGDESIVLSNNLSLLIKTLITHPDFNELTTEDLLYYPSEHFARATYEHLKKEMIQKGLDAAGYKDPDDSTSAL